MTTVITRYFEHPSHAEAAENELIHAERVPRGILSTYSNAGDMAGLSAAGLMTPEAAQAYAGKLASGGAVLMARAGYRPLGVAATVRRVTAQMGAADLGDVPQELRAKDEPKPLLSIISDHSHMMTRRIDESSTRRHMANWPIPLISRSEPFRGSVIQRNGYMANLVLPLTIRTKPYVENIYDNRHARMANWPIGYLVPGHRYMAKFPFAHLVPGHKFMAKFPFAHLVPGKGYMANWPIKHLVPGHAFMARWPFPHLINGKQGQNALVPGHKYMAKFPFAHLVPGHKYQAKFPFGHIVPGHKYQARFPFGHIVPGHRYMAKFPFAHLVPGHRFMAKFPFAHLVPGHKFMANFIWPHTKRKAA